MNPEYLAALLQSPEILRKILGDYEDGYAIGVTQNPDNPQEPAIRVRIRGDYMGDIPAWINIDGEPIRVIVTPNYVVPMPISW